MNYKFAITILAIAVLLHSARYFDFGKRTFAKNGFVDTWSKLREKRITYWAYKYSGNIKKENYNEFLFYYIYRALLRFYGWRQPMIFSWYDEALFDRIVNSDECCMVLSPHYMYPCTAMAVTAFDRHIACVAKRPEWVTEHYRNYGIYDTTKVEIIKGDTKCLVRLAGAARRKSILIGHPDLRQKNGSSYYVDFFKFCHRANIPMYFAKYHVNAHGEFEGNLKGPFLKRDPDEAMTDFIAFHGTGT